MKKRLSNLLWSALLLCIAGYMFSTVLPGCGEKKVAPPVAGDTVAVDVSKYWVCSTDCAGLPDSLRPTKRAVGVKGKQWPQKQILPVQLIQANAEQKQTFEKAASDWANECNITFTYPTTGPYKIRCAFSPTAGSWSYIGKDNESIPSGSWTMNIGFKDGGSYYPVMIHELGHSLFLAHEHQNPNNPFDFDESVVIARLSGPPNNWNLATIHFNILDLWAKENVIATNRDDISVMMYNMPPEFFKNKIGVTGGKVLSPVDKSFIASIYPKAIQPPPPPPPTTYTVTQAQRNNLKRITAKTKAATDAAKVAGDSLKIITDQIFGAN